MEKKKKTNLSTIISKLVVNSIINGKPEQLALLIAIIDEWEKNNDSKVKSKL